MKGTRAAHEKPVAQGSAALADPETAVVVCEFMVVLGHVPPPPGAERARWLNDLLAGLAKRD